MPRNPKTTIIRVSRGYKRKHIRFPRRLVKFSTKRLIQREQGIEDLTIAIAKVCEGKRVDIVQTALEKVREGCY